jgi:hypothetical protein
MSLRFIPRGGIGGHHRLRGGHRHRLLRRLRLGSLQSPACGCGCARAAHAPCGAAGPSLAGVRQALLSRGCGRPFSRGRAHPTAGYPPPIPTRLRTRAAADERRPPECGPRDTQQMGGAGGWRGRRSGRWRRGRGRCRRTGGPTGTGRAGRPTGTTRRWAAAAGPTPSRHTSPSSSAPSGPPSPPGPPPTTPALPPAGPPRLPALSVIGGVAGMTAPPCRSGLAAGSPPAQTMLGCCGGLRRCCGGLRGCCGGLHLSCPDRAWRQRRRRRRRRRPSRASRGLLPPLLCMRGSPGPRWPTGCDWPTRDLSNGKAHPAREARHGSARLPVSGHATVPEQHSNACRGTSIRMLLKSIRIIHRVGGLDLRGLLGVADAARMRACSLAGKGPERNHDLSRP